jgi:hypothetical protein
MHVVGATPLFDQARGKEGEFLHPAVESDRPGPDDKPGVRGQAKVEPHGLGIGLSGVCPVGCGAVKRRAGGFGARRAAEVHQSGDAGRKTGEHFGVKLFAACVKRGMTGPHMPGNRVEQRRG